MTATKLLSRRGTAMRSHQDHLRSVCKIEQPVENAVQLHCFRVGPSDFGTDGQLILSSPRLVPRFPAKKYRLGTVSNGLINTDGLHTCKRLRGCQKKSAQGLFTRELHGLWSCRMRGLQLEQMDILSKLVK